MLLTYGVLKLVGLAVFLYLLDSAGGFRKKNPLASGSYAGYVLFELGVP